MQYLVQVVTYDCSHSLIQVVFGSMSPFYEALALAMGARHITVIEVGVAVYTKIGGF